MGTTLYSTAYCPYGWSARIVLYEKGVLFDTFEVDLKNQQPEFLAVSPRARVPVFVDGKTQIVDALVINEYIEETYPEPNLLGATPAERAAVRSTVIDHDWIRSQPLARVMAMLLHRPELREEEGMHRHLGSWYRYLDRLERHFASDAWRVLGRYTLADVSIYTTVAISRGFGMQVGERPALSACMRRMSRREPVRRAAPERLPAAV
ncbi:MAG: glutathione S-transferase family protein [Myxococcales bacterium]|nr:MAG: glutathione S-transferase family protein [Myxococcales bacterium]